MVSPRFILNSPINLTGSFRPVSFSVQIQLQQSSYRFRRAKNSIWRDIH